MGKEYEFEDKGEELAEDHEADEVGSKKQQRYPGVNKKALKVNMGIGKSGLKAENEPMYTKETSPSEDGGPYRTGQQTLAKMANARKGLSYGREQ